MVVFHNKVKNFCVEKKRGKKLSRKQPPLTKTSHKEEEKKKTWHNLFLSILTYVWFLKKIILITYLC